MRISEDGVVSPIFHRDFLFYLSVISKKKTISPKCDSFKKTTHFFFYLPTSHFQNQRMIFLGLLDKGSQGASVPGLSLGLDFLPGS